MYRIMFYLHIKLRAKNQSGMYFGTVRVVHIIWAEIRETKDLEKTDYLNFTSIK